MRLGSTFLAVMITASFAVGSVMITRNSGWPGQMDAKGSSRLPNGQRIQPAGRLHIPLHGDLPLAMVASADGSQCLVVTGGYHDQGISLINLFDETSDRYIPMTKCTGGLVALGDGSYFASSGDLGIRRIIPSSDKDNCQPTSFKLSEHPWIQSLAKLPDGSVLATDMNNDQLLSLDPIKEVVNWSLKVGHKPNRLAIDPLGQKIAVANWGGSSVSFFGFSGQALGTTAVGVHPSELVYGSRGTLFVSNAGSNTVSVLQNSAVIATVFTSLVTNDLVGSTPTGLALSPDRSHLYVTNSGNNNVAVLNVSEPLRTTVEGFIPTGWYPTTVFVDQGGKRMIVGTGKGLRAVPNSPGIKPDQTLSDDLRTHYDYLPNRLEGDLMVVNLPSNEKLAEMTAVCRRNAEREASAEITRNENSMVPTLRKIKHVLYIIRENRSYDQVLGDLAGTNADPKLCMYGEKVTPNGHKIARTFKTFDNLYCDGEVSQDGHQWCCASYCTDFTEKAWPSGYADRGSADGDESLTSSPAGYLWDNCRKHGLTYRSYGEFASFSANKESAPKFNGESGLEGHASEKWSLSGERDMDKANIFIEEMKEAEAKGRWWNFMVMSLGEDHTDGRNPGSFTPFSKVASNDVGLGKIVDSVSHSKFWRDTAIFVIQDDAQDGPDHVDGHRTVGYVISPFIRRGGADHTLYSTASMIRTMELILGLPPMSQQDRHATSMLASFAEQPNLTPFQHVEAKIDLSARNPKQGPLATASSKLDFSHFDRVDPDVLNRILWADAKPGVPYPVISHLTH